MINKEEVKLRRDQVREEIGAAQRIDRNAIRNQAEALQGLIAHPGWKVYQTIVAAQAQNHMANLQRPLKSPDEVMVQEYTKGTLNGLSTALMTVQGTIEQAKQLGVFNDDEAPVAETPPGKAE